MLRGPVSEQFERSSFVMSPPSSPMFDGSVKPLLPARPQPKLFFACGITPLAFRRIISTGSSPVHARHVHSKKRSVEVLRPGTEPTLELVPRCIEVGQIGKFTEFLGQPPCKNRGNFSVNVRRSVRVLPNAPWSLQRAILSCLRFVRAPHSGGMPPVKL